MTYSICSKIFLMLSGRSLNLVDFVNGGGPCGVKDELVRLEDWPKPESPVELPS
jgi:hypothetical protein